MTGEENGGFVHNEIYEKDDFADIFGTPPRPSTPPPKASSNAGPFKTPTHPTPSHRPVTRSVTRSMRSARSINSPGLLLMDRTPTRTPRSGAVKRLSPNDMLPSHLFNMSGFDTPLRRSMNELMSEAGNFVVPSPQRGVFQLDMSTFPPLDMAPLTSGDLFDIGNEISTNVPMPSSPPTLRSGPPFGRSLTYDGGHADDWTQHLDHTNPHSGMHDMENNGGSA